MRTRKEVSVVKYIKSEEGRGIPAMQTKRRARGSRLNGNPWRWKMMGRRLCGRRGEADVEYDLTAELTCPSLESI